MAKYLHTLNGRPANFDGFQICYASFYGRPSKLAESLDQIKKERQLSKANREKAGFSKDGMRYGHFRYE